MLVDRKVIASCDPGRKQWNTVMGPLRDALSIQGSLWLIEYDGNNAKVKEMELNGYPSNKVFHPLGVQVWPSQDGSSSNMFVVNHGMFRTTIEQFSIDPTQPYKAKYRRTIRSKYFLSPNALALTSPTSFFISNDHLLTRRLPSFLGKVLPLLETFSGLPLGFVSHVSIYNENSNSAIIRHTIPKLGIPFPNGIALSPDKRMLAVASSSYMRVQLFERRMDANGTEILGHTKSVSVPFCPDNIHADDGGSWIVAGHPYFPGLTAIARGASEVDVHPPSWVVSLSERNGTGSISNAFDQNAPYSASRRHGPSASHELTTLYQGDGTVFAGSTTGLVDSRTGSLFVTGLYQEGLLICRG